MTPTSTPRPEPRADGSAPEVSFVFCRQHHDPPEADARIESWDRLDEMMITPTSAPVSESPQNRPIVAVLVDGEKFLLNDAQPLVVWAQSVHPRAKEAWGGSAVSGMLNPMKWFGSGS